MGKMEYVKGHVRKLPDGTMVKVKPHVRYRIQVIDGKARTNYDFDDLENANRFKRQIEGLQKDYGVLVKQPISVYYDSKTRTYQKKKLK